MQQIVDTAVEIKELIDNNIEPVDKLRWLNNALKLNAQIICQSLNESDKLEFYKIVIKGVADKLLTRKAISSPNVTNIFYKLKFSISCRCSSSSEASL